MFSSSSPSGLDEGHFMSFSVSGCVTESLLLIGLGGFEGDYVHCRVHSSGRKQTFVGIELGSCTNANMRMVVVGSM